MYSIILVKCLKVYYLAATVLQLTSMLSALYRLKGCCTSTNHIYTIINYTVSIIIYSPVTADEKHAVTPLIMARSVNNLKFSTH